MRSFRSKPVGWRGESHRHYLAAKGVRTKHEYFMVRTFNISRKALDVIPPEKHDAAIARMRAGEEVQDIVQDLAGIEGFTGKKKSSQYGPRGRQLDEEDLVTALVDIGELKGSWPTIADVKESGISTSSWSGSFHDVVQKAVERVKDDPEVEWHLSGVRRKTVERVPLRESEEQIQRRIELVESADARAAARRREEFHKTLMVQKLKILEDEKEEIVGLLSLPSPGLDAGSGYVDERRKRIGKIDAEINRLKSVLEEKGFFAIKWRKQRPEEVVEWWTPQEFVKRTHHQRVEDVSVSSPHYADDELGIRPTWEMPGRLAKAKNVDLLKSIYSSEPNESVEDGCQLL